jgi:beta-phosphoglucomutase-like phosphatase (HAD superfamily)
MDMNRELAAPGAGLIELQSGGCGLWQAGNDGVKRILALADRKVEFIEFENKTLAYVKSEMGHPAMYDFRKAEFDGPAEAVLMDLDGTTVLSEPFWMRVIERTVAELAEDAGFMLDADDEPHVSGHSVSEHLQYCVQKYCPGKTVGEARAIYYKIADREMEAISRGCGRQGAFLPAPGLRDFLLALKAHGIKVGLVTSGTYRKAWPEIAMAFGAIGMGNPLDFYDAIITAGQPFGKAQTGSIAELAAKPHPWLYAETARIGLGIAPEKRSKVIGIEDSAAGVVALRLAGFAAIGVNGGNIAKSGADALTSAKVDSLADALPMILAR